MEKNVQILPINPPTIDENVIEGLIPTKGATALIAAAALPPEEIREQLRNQYLAADSQGVIVFLIGFTEKYGVQTATGSKLEMTEANEKSVLVLETFRTTAMHSIEVTLTKNGKKPLIVLTDRVPGEERILLGSEAKWLKAIREAAIQNERIAEAQERQGRRIEHTRLANDLAEDV